MSRQARNNWLLCHRRAGSGRRAKRLAAGKYSSFHRLLRFEPLEDRRLLATITVNTLIDESDGSIVDGDVSLRDAINLAAANDTINFSVTGTINLTSLGELDINKDLTINGPGANLLTINSVDPTPGTKNGDGSRIFNITDYAPTVRNVSISGLTLTGADEAGPGGAIRNRENLMLSSSVVTGNHSNSADGGGGIANSFGGVMTLNNVTVSNNSAVNGGGVWSSTGNVTVQDSTISGNSADSQGGGICSRATLNVYNSTIAGNTASYGGGILGRDGITISINGSTIANNRSPNSNGGGIEVVSATLNVSNSTISGNVTASGGGILSYFSTTTIVSSTISDNTATFIGAAIMKYYGTLNVFHSTITNNRANTQGGGIQSLGSATGLDHTILAGNRVGVGFTSDQDIFGPAAARFSLIGTNSGATIANNGGNLIGTAASPIDPMLDPLADNGGRTFTHALKPGSPALEAGDPAAVAGIGNVPLSEQRGAPFVRVFDNDGIGGARIDIGAFERQSLPAGLSLVVDTLVDENDLNYGPGDFSLREAIILANGSAGANTITFAPSLAGGTILLTKGELLIRDEVAINGPLTQLLTIDASGNDPTPILNNGDGSRVFNIDNGNLTADFTATLSDLTITGADAGVPGFDIGGGISSQEHLSLTNCIVFNNSATGSGGGIYADGNLTVTNCTISGNHTGNDGGGIRASGDNMTITGSQISGNSADDDGGGIRVGASSITIIGSTINGNTAGGDGGGMRSAAGAGTVTVTGSTISNNTATGDGGGIDDRSSGELIVTKSTISGNTGANGGGIANHDGLLTVTSSTISGNTAPSQGGGIYNTIGQMTLTTSTVSGNTGGFGGGILGRSGSMEIIGSTISGNQSPNSNGGGIEAVFTTLNVSNSTVSGNTAGVGGGIFSYASTSTISNSTITANNGIFFGGGIAVTNGGSMTLTSTIVAGNLRVAARDDISGTVTANYTLVGVNTGATINTTEGGNLVGTSGAPIDPLLGPLANNLGPTKTHKLLSGSPAIDTGRPGFMPSLSFDQRGTPFVRAFDGDGVGGARLDIGAYELQPDPPAARGDFSQNGLTDAGDYVLWRNSIGASVSPYSGADADGDGIVGQTDFFVWRDHFGEMAPPPGAGSGASVEGGGGSVEGGGESGAMAASLAEPVPQAEQPPAMPGGVAAPRPDTGAQQLRGAETGVQRIGRSRPRGPRQDPAAMLRRDDALVAWLDSCNEGPEKVSDEMHAGNKAALGDGQDCPSYGEAIDDAFDALDATFQALKSGVGR